ncbi:MAG: glucose 1-dehydrogenase [Pseudomonadales bacterium]|nr:glucose 1-dehydrogenase [Pseudomonadales bacterium]
MELENKVAIVTGGASGFGKAIAEAFIEEGAKVVIADLNIDAANDVVNCLGRSARAFQVDVTSPQQVQEMVDFTEHEFGGLNVMINNAGTTHHNKPMLEVSEAEFDQCMNVNVKSFYFNALSVVPAMRRAGGGSIINICSIGGIRPRPGLAWYSASKGAAIVATKAMAVELAEDAISVNALCPALSSTGLIEKFIGMPDTPENRAKFVATIPMGRFAEPNDVANAAVFLGSERSRFVTGTELIVDGGRCV